MKDLRCRWCFRCMDDHALMDAPSPVCLPDGWITEQPLEKDGYEPIAFPTNDDQGKSEKRP